SFHVGRLIGLVDHGHSISGGRGLESLPCVDCQQRRPPLPVSSGRPPASQPMSQPSPTRSIFLLAIAGFASQAQVRVTDSLLPQIAADFGTTVGAASIVVTAYALTHGSSQLFIGPIGDRFGKYPTVMVMCVLSAILVMICGLTQSLEALATARLFAGATAGWI